MTIPLLLLMATCLGATGKNGSNSVLTTCNLSCDQRQSTVLPPLSFHHLYPTNIMYCSVATADNDTNVCSLGLSDFFAAAFLQKVCKTQEDVLALDCAAQDRLEIKFSKPSSFLENCAFKTLILLNCDARLESFGIFFHDPVALRRNYKWIYPPFSLHLHNWKPTAIERHNELDAVMLGLKSLTLSQDKPLLTYIPKHIYTTRWVHLELLEVKNISMVDAEALLNNMPDLQEVTVTHSKLDHPPWHCSLSTSNICNKLILSNNQFKIIPDFQFRGPITVLDLSFNDIYYVKDNAFSMVTGLQNLDISNNKLMSINANLFKKLSNLEILKLDHNRIDIIPSDLQEYFITTLNWVDISYNNISEFHKTTSIFGRTSLSSLNLKKNYLAEIPSWFFSTRSLVNLDVSDNLLSLEDIAGKLSEVLTFLPYSPALSLPVYKDLDFSNNRITSLNLKTFQQNVKVLVDSEYVLRFFISLFNIDLTNNQIRCDCHMYTMSLFLKSLRSSPEEEDELVKVPEFNLRNWRCMEPPMLRGIPVAEVALSDFMCEAKLKDCPYQCKCLLRSHDRSVFVNCSSRDLENFPENVPDRTNTLDLTNNKIQFLRHNAIRNYYQTLRKLYLADNIIKAVDEGFGDNLQSLEFLSLDRNRITYLPMSFKGLKNTSLSFTGNPIMCDCESKWIVPWMFQYRKSIAEVEKVACASGKPTGEIIITANTEDFICEMSVGEPLAIFFGVVIAIVLCLVLPVYKFRGEIRLFLYIRFHWRPFHNDIDSDILDMRYDAFVACCSDDSWWVKNTLVPALETPEHPYRLCISDRDFLPGESIIDNIINGIDHSRRMILILTKNFLKSEWCRFEFQMAHWRVLKKHTRYLMVVMLDDVETKDVTKEMMIYLRTHTYTKTSDKWFWSKLYYGLPDQPLLTLRGHSFPAGGFKPLYPFFSVNRAGSTAFIPATDSSSSDTGIEEASIA